MQYTKSFTKVAFDILFCLCIINLNLKNMNMDFTHVALVMICLFIITLFKIYKNKQIKEIKAELTNELQTLRIGVEQNILRMYTRKKLKPEQGSPCTCLSCSKTFKTEETTVSEFHGFTVFGMIEKFGMFSVKCPHCEKTNGYELQPGDENGGHLSVYVPALIKNDWYNSK